MPSDHLSKLVVEFSVLGFPLLFRFCAEAFDLSLIVSQHSFQDRSRQTSKILKTTEKRLCQMCSARRRHIVITANPAYRALGCELASSPAAALVLVQDEPEVLVIGGEMLYRTFLPAAGRLYLTLVATRIEDGDAFFPPWEPGEWVETGRETRARDEGNPFDLTFLRLDRAVVDGDDGVDGIPAT